MKLRIFVLSLVSWLASCFAGCDSGQTSDYAQDFEWMVRTFEENDAGFEYYLAEKGAKDYTRHLDTYREKIGRAKTDREFLSLANEWLHYFRKQHIGVLPIGMGPLYGKQLTPAQQEYAKNTYADASRIDMDEQEFKRYLADHAADIDPIEGIWNTKWGTTGVVRAKGGGDAFDAFLLEDSSVGAMQGTILATFSPDSDGRMAALYANGNKGEVKKIGKSGGMIQISGIWVKTYPEVEFTERERFFAKAALSPKPFLEKLGEKTVYVRIPSFNMSQKKDIDSLLNSNGGLIRSTPNLIVDIRYGTGGGDPAHMGLLPYYYTQPIRLTGQKLRATELNAQAYEGYAGTAPDSAYVKLFTKKAETIRKNIGNYIETFSAESRFGYLKNLKYPERVAIITKDNGSADEGLLFNARQSYKTKIFGHPSAGAFDMGNVNMVEFPNGKYYLWLAMTVDYRYPQYKIDDIGIQPDFYIDEAISDENWLDYVRSVIEAR